MRRAAGLRAFAIGLGILLTRYSSASGGLPDLTGTWKLNVAESDDPQSLRETPPSSGGSSDSGDSAPPPGGGHHGRGGGRRHGGGDGASGGASWLEARERLIIRHVDPELEITDAAGHERTLYTDGRKTEEERSYGGTTKVTASWKDGHIEVTSQAEKGPKIVQTYAVSADGAQLNVTTKIEGRRPMTIRSVYDAVREGSPAPQPSSGSDSIDDDVEVTAGAAGAR